MPKSGILNAKKWRLTFMKWTLGPGLFIFSDRTVRLWHLTEDHASYGNPEVLRRHSLSVNQVRFSPQGTMLATCSADGTAVISDLLVRIKKGSFINAPIC